MHKNKWKFWFFPYFYFVEPRCASGYFKLIVEFRYHSLLSRYEESKYSMTIWHEQIPCIIPNKFWDSQDQARPQKV